MQFAFRLAAAIGCTVRELPDRVSWDEWISWQAWYALQPWGEERADLRSAVAVAYQLAPYLPREAELPTFQYPYTEDEPLDAQQLKAAAEAEARRWAEWEQERRAQRGAKG